MPDYRRDLTSGGTYFFTVTLADRCSAYLVDHIDILRRAYAIAADARPFETVAICVLPDHLHAVWTLPEGDHDYSGRWALIKSRFSSQLTGRPDLAESKTRKREKGIWQRRFWEHRIRDSDDLARHVDYIHYNPVRHGFVGAVGDWPYSSFHRYVKNGMLPMDWSGDRIKTISGRFGE